MIEWKKWKHVTKLDPDKPLSPREVAGIVDSGTDALMVSGTQNITKDNVARLVGMLRDYRIPKVLEPAGMDGLRDDLDFLFVPSVFNTDNTLWTTGFHRRWVEKYPIEWEKVVPEAYLVLNPRSAVARVTRSVTSLTSSEVAAYAVCADRFFQFPIVYVEYSGTYGNPAVVRAVKEKLSGARLFYGGGINSRQKAVEMSMYADTIVVGNMVYETGGVEKLKETVL